MAPAASAREPAPVGGAASATPCCCFGLVRRVPQFGLIGLSIYFHSGMVKASVSVFDSGCYWGSPRNILFNPQLFVSDSGCYRGSPRNILFNPLVISVRPSPLFSFFFSNWLTISKKPWLSTSKKPLEVFYIPGIKTGFVFPPEIAPGTSPYKPEGRKMPIACGANQTARKKMAQMTVKLFYYRLISNIHQTV